MKRRRTGTEREIVRGRGGGCGVGVGGAGGGGVFGGGGGGWGREQPVFSVLSYSIYTLCGRADRVV